MGYKPAYIWNGTAWDQIGNQAVASLNSYALLAPVVGQNITNTTLTSASINSASVSGTFSGDVVFSGSNTHSGNLNVTGRLDVGDIRETVNTGTITASVLTADYSTGEIYYISASPTSNFTVNVTNVPTDNNKAIAIVVLVNQGTTGYIPNAIQIGGVGQTLRWSSGSTPTPTSSANKIDIFNFTLIRVSSSWIVLGNSSLNF